MTSHDQAPAAGGTTRRARRARSGMTDASRTPTLPFSDTSDAAPTAVLEASDAADSGPETQEVAPRGDSEESEQGTEDADSDLFGLGIDDTPEASEPSAEWADADRPATALTWLETADVEETTLPPDLNAVTMADPGSPLLSDAKVRPALLTGRWLAPLGTLVALVIAYSVTMLVWPLNAVLPTVESVEIATVPAVTADMTWPAAGSAGVSIAGVSSSASTLDAASIASITKVVTSLMVLDRMPLQLGEPGPDFAFSYGDSVEFWNYLRANQSALDVPVDGVLSEYQMLQGTLLGSANNYVDRLARDIWGSDAQFAQAAETWLAERDLTGITITSPSGFDEGNVATPEALLKLAERAMQNPVFAEIVGTAGAEIPGAGYVENTNGMLGDPGVVGIKTGTLVGWCLLTAKDVTIGDTTVHLYASVLNQADDAERLAVTRSLFSQVETALEDIDPAVSAGTVVGNVHTIWGGDVDIVSDEDAEVILWNGATATAAADLLLGDERAAGDGVGSLTVNGPVNAQTVDVSLAEDVTGPGFWWRLTHPLDLLGINAK